MTAWTELLGDQLATVAGGQQTLFPTHKHLGGEQYCMLIVTTHVCPGCPAFMERVRALKPELASKGVGVVALYAVDTERQHLQMAEEYGEVQMPIGFPTPPELLEKKRHLNSLIGQAVPAYAVFDRNLEMLLGPVVNDVMPLRDWLQTLQASESDAPPAAAGTAEGDASRLAPDEETGGEADGEAESDEALA